MNKCIRLYSYVLHKNIFLFNFLVASPFEYIRETAALSYRVIAARLSHNYSGNRKVILISTLNFYIFISLQF